MQVKCGAEARGFVVFRSARSQAQAAYAGGGGRICSQRAIRQQRLLARVPLAVDPSAEAIGACIGGIAFLCRILHFFTVI